MIARYGQLHDDDIPDLTQASHLARLLAEAFTRSGIDSRPARAEGTGWPGLVVTLDTLTYLIQVVWSTSPVRRETIDEVAETAKIQHGVRHVLVSIAGYEPAAAHHAQTLRPSSLTLMDRTHIEAILSGLIEPGTLITGAAHHAIFDGRPYSTVTDLLLGETRPAPALFIRADRLPAPWPLQNDSGTDSADVRHLFTGDDGWPDPQGITVVDPAHALVTVPDGILTVDLKHGTTDWLLPAAGCRGTALAAADGSVLTLCADAVIRWHDGAVTVVGGGFPDARVLLPGPDNRPWVLSGHGPHFGSGTATLALTRLDGTPGRQQRHRIHFDADVHTAGWLEDLRFFLAAAGHSAVVDLARSTRVRRDDWIETPHSRPDHLVVADPHHVITASSHSSGARATIYRTNITTATSTLVADLALNYVKGLAAVTNDRLLLLGDVRGNDVHIPHPVLVTIHENTSRGHGEPVGATAREQNTITTTEPGQRLHDLSMPEKPVGSAATKDGEPADPYGSVRLAARGERRDCALAPKPIANGGQATVFRATHKTTGVEVALKRLQTRDEDALARMRREVDAARRYGNHPNVVPVLDFSSTGDWFVMPLAQDTAGSLPEAFNSDEHLRELVTAICHALREPHQDGWIHRDLKPDNILRLGARWAVADWGLGRRPRGQTTDPRRTRIGGPFGTEGFAAPELSVNAHLVDPRTDIYSIGQIIGWAKVHRWPQANVPLLPDSGPWRTIAKAATHTDPGRRPATVDDLLALIARELDEPAEDPTNQGERLLTAIRSGDPTGVGQLVDLTARNAGHYDLYLNVLVQLDHDQTQAAVAANPSAMREIVRGVLELDSGNGVTLEYGDVDQLITWLLAVARHAEAGAEWDLLEETADSIFYLDLWDRWRVQSDISTWMAELSRHAASVVAEALRRNPENRPHFAKLAANRRVDHRIRQAFDD